MLRVVKFNQENLRQEVYLRGKMECLVDWAINEPGCCAGFIEFNKVSEADYPFAHNEIHYVLSGKARYSFTSHPNYMEEGAETMEAGDLCLIRYGTMAKFEPLERPYRVLYVVMPMPEVPYRPFDREQ